tara:strand:+ start:541 stop:654 length:114 start_codon:yes stop_codon:yes gene_type:complete
MYKKKANPAKFSKGRSVKKKKKIGVKGGRAGPKNRRI